MNVKKVFRAMTLISVVLAGSINLDAQTKASDTKASDVNVNQKATVLILEPQEMTLKPGETKKITVKSVSETAESSNQQLESNKLSKSAKWSSDNEKVATVDKDGNVKAIAGGKAIITATIKGSNSNLADSKNATGDQVGTCKVFVEKKNDKNNAAEKNTVKNDTKNDKKRNSKKSSSKNNAATH